LSQSSFCSEYQKSSQWVGNPQKDSPAKQILTVGIYGSLEEHSNLSETKFLQTYSAINAERVPLPAILVIKEKDNS